MGFLYERIDGWRDVIEAEVPDYIPKNLNPKFELREYQIKAFENFIMYFENKKCPRPLQVLFHMATGSGKTLIMAGLMLYLYKQGYRNFLFFVNLTNIIDKTRENFLNATSKKYLFAEEIIIDGEKIKINVTENFQSVDDDAINICFETTQGLHSDIFFHKENKMTDEDFKNMKVVLISDEAHHLNVDTKKGSSAENTTWESTVRKIFESNVENILLEFTATCDINNAEIKKFYEDKIIFNYPLQNFYNDKYSKDILSVKSDFPPIEKALQAIILSQYRLKIFQEHRLNIKPIILFKSLKIKDSEKFLAEFLDMIKNLDGNYLEKFFEKCTLPIMESAKKYFLRKEISFEMLAAELRDDFSEQHCISVNDDKDAQKNQIQLNSLENVDNPYRAIFEVKKLDEGWDVLNLFDIVRLYETRQSGGKKISAATISEAQLIGRGARYCPFKIDDEQPKFQRKFDSDIDCELRICETLYYHCQNDSRYISELKDALKKICFNMDNIISREYKLKKNFKDSEFYKTGKIFLNRRIEKNLTAENEISPSIRDNVYNFKISAGASGQSNLMTDGADIESKSSAKFFHYTIKEIAAKNYSIVHKALRKFPIFKFSNLKNIFPNLKSVKNFIVGEKFLGNIKIEIESDKENLNCRDLYRAVCEVLKKIAAEISAPKKEYEGTKDFYATDMRKIFTDKTVNYSSRESGLGESQKVDANFQLDLSAKNWFAYEDNFGTAEEKAFVKYFGKHYDELREHWDKIFLVRNERQFHIYSFDGGKRFEPDYVLFLQKNNSETWQIFIEPKGSHLIESDKWKENFLLDLKNIAVAKKFYVDDPNYKILGFHFYNHDAENIFDADFRTLISD